MLEHLNEKWQSLPEMFQHKQKANSDSKTVNSSISCAPVPMLEPLKTRTTTGKMQLEQFEEKICTFFTTATPLRDTYS